MIEGAGPGGRPRVLVSWSSGKDSAWMLHLLRQDPSVQVAGLLTTINETMERVAMHGVRRSLLDAQARAVQLPLHPVLLPWPCSNEEYERRMRDATRRAVAEGYTHVAFGDLFLEDVRAYREAALAGSGLTPLFPLWGQDTTALAATMIASGVEAVVTVVDTRQLGAGFAGRAYDARFLGDLPPGVDPCGERGEFHTFVYGGPMLGAPLRVTSGEAVDRDGFRFVDVREPEAGAGAL